MRSLLRFSIRAIAISASLAFVAPAATAQSAPPITSEWSRYMNPLSLSSLMDAGSDLQVIDIRSRKYVKNGTIPGAIWIPFADWRAPKDRPGQMLTEVELEELLGDHGVDLNRPIVVHNHSAKTIQTGRAAIVYWTLKSAGAEDIAVLEGGFKAWTEANLPEAEAPTRAEPTMVDVTYRGDWWADAMDIFAVTSGQVDGAILDARLDAQVRKSVETGEPMMSMPMARYVPASLFTNPMSSRRLTSEGQAEFMAELAERGIDPGEGFLISVCQTGELSALSWFYASEILELEDVRYYPDALRGWKADGGLMFGMRAPQ